MSTSIFLARLIGPVMTLVGVSLLVDEAAFRKMALEFLRNLALIFFSGMIMMSAGLVVVLTHNVWVLDWQVILTLPGAVAVISGPPRGFAPQRGTKVGEEGLADQAYITPGAAIWLLSSAVGGYCG